MTLAAMEIGERNWGSHMAAAILPGDSEGSSDTGGACREERSGGPGSRLEQVALAGLVT